MRAPIRNSKSPVRNRALSAALRPLFWDYDVAKLRWPRDRELVIARVLQKGTWDNLCWLRRRAGDRALRAWIIRRRGRGLDPPDLRFWELILHIPRCTVNAWLADPERPVWDRRRWFEAHHGPIFPEVS